ncbi:chorismate synthase, partial [Kitasatospora sp. NPDC059747]|uniref:chorismate synthase n=1 Tax=unclassified Kitasatospora TaxID=2633591 RepID=UPI003654A772
MRDQDLSRLPHRTAPAVPGTSGRRTTLTGLRWLTAGESHGPALVATLEGLPAGVPVTTAVV